MNANAAPQTEFSRRDVSFRSGKDDCAAWLYSPPGEGESPGKGESRGEKGTAGEGSGLVKGDASGSGSVKGDGSGAGEAEDAGAVARPGAGEGEGAVARPGAGVAEGAGAVARPGAIVVLGHGLGAVKEMGLDVYAERFVAAGYSALVFDYRHFGASGGTPRQLLDIGRQLEDWRAAVSYARSLPSVDPARVALFGSSFGGGHAIRTAAADPDIAATIAQCPFTDGVASGLTLGPVSSVKVGALALRDTIAAARGREPVRVALAGAPNSASLMSTPDALPGFIGLVPEGTDFTNAVAARIGLRIPVNSPGRAAAKVKGPIMFCVCEKDSVAPAKATLKHAARAPRGEVFRYPVGHFEIYTGEPFERAVADQVAFLGRHLG